MRPVVPSTITVCPLSTAAVRSGMPNTAGSSSDRAIMAVCPSAPPMPDAKPAISPGSIRAVSAGVISVATITLPEGAILKA